jgi:hypothetical protein
MEQITVACEGTGPELLPAPGFAAELEGFLGAAR